MKRKVKKIIDGDTFDVVRKWNWHSEEGHRIRPTGYNAPEKGEPDHGKATRKLSRILTGKQVDLKKCHRVDRGRLVCDVNLDGKNLADFFPEYQ